MAINQFYKDIKLGKINASRDFRDFAYGTMLWIMSQHEGVSADGMSWVGENEWQDLWNDQDFVQNYATKDAVRRSAPDLVNLAICTLKFDRTDSALENAKNYFIRARDMGDPPARKAARYFALGLIALINKNDTEATENLRRAEEYDPANFRLSEYLKNYASYQNSYDYRIYDVAARRNRVTNFSNKLQDLLKQIGATNPQATLADELRAAASRGEPDDGSRYYHHWLAALERMVTAKGLADSPTLVARKEVWTEAYRRTRHGKPVEPAAESGSR